MPKKSNFRSPPAQPGVYLDEIRSKIEQFVAYTALLRLQGTLPCHVAAAVRQNADVPHPYDQGGFLDQLSANTTKYNATFEGYSS